MGIKHEGLGTDTVYRTIATTLLGEEGVKHHHLDLFALFYYPASTPYRLHCLLKWFVTSKGNQRMRISDTGDKGSQAVRSLQDNKFATVICLGIQTNTAPNRTSSYLQSL